MEESNKHVVQLESLDKLQRLDHDTLVRLETKFDSMMIDIKELKEGTATRLTKVEARLDDLEKLRDEVNPKEVVAKVNEVYQQQHDFHLTWKVVVAVAAGIGAVVGFLLSALVNISFLFGK